MEDMMKEKKRLSEAKSKFEEKKSEENERHKKKVSELKSELTEKGRKILEDTKIDEISEKHKEVREKRKKVNENMKEAKELVGRTLVAMTGRQRTSNVDDGGWRKSGITLRDGGVYPYNRTRELGLDGIHIKKEMVIGCFEENKKRKKASEIVNKGKKIHENYLKMKEYAMVKQLEGELVLKVKFSPVSPKFVWRRKGEHDWDGLFLRTNFDYKAKSITEDFEAIIKTAKHEDLILDMLNEVEETLDEVLEEQERIIDKIREIGSSYLIERAL